jgi:hypothetical protein
MKLFRNPIRGLNNIAYVGGCTLIKKGVVAIVNDSLVLD